jgi:hypothetical protein
MAGKNSPEPENHTSRVLYESPGRYVRLWRVWEYRMRGQLICDALLCYNYATALQLRSLGLSVIGICAQYARVIGMTFIS